MNHTEAIWFIIGLTTLGIPLGVFVAIKTIKKLTTPPMNVITRDSGDIQLEYISHDQSYTTNLLDSPYTTNERITSLAPTYQTGAAPPSFQSGILPSYHSGDRFNVYSIFEDSINIDLIFMFLIFLFFMIIFLNSMKSPWIKYLVKGFLMNQLTDIIKIFLWLIIFSIVLFIIHYTLMNSLYAMCLLIPFSFFEIDFRDSFEWELELYREKHVISYLKIQTLTQDIESLLNSLKDDVNYSMSLSFISSYNEWKKDNKTPYFINDAIIVNKESDPILITQFIMRSLNDKDLFKTDLLFSDESINRMDPVILTVIVSINIKI